MDKYGACLDEVRMPYVHMFGKLIEEKEEEEDG